MAKKIKQKQRPYLSSEASDSMEFLRSFLRRHFAGKPEVASRNSVFFLRLGFQAKIPSINLVYNQICHRISGILLASSKFGQRRLVLKN